MTQPPPQDVVAEDHVIGSLLISNDLIDDVADILTPADFYRPSNGELFREIVQLRLKGEPADVVTLKDRQRVAELSQIVPASANVMHYVRIVKDCASRRAMIQLAHEAIREAHGDGDASRIERLAFELSQERTRGDLSPVAKDAAGIVSRLEDRQAGKLRGTQLGFHRLDRMTAGLQPGNLMVLAAGTSVGKSALSLSVIAHLALKQARPVAMFTLEMSREEIADRLASIVSGVALQDIRQGEVGREECERIIRAASDIGQAPLYLDATPAVSLTEARSKLRRLKARQPGLALAVVDYLQLMTPPSGESRYEQVTQIARGLKHLAQDVGVPVLALSQLNRNRDQRADKRPILSDLRESGEIEQAADIVAFIHKDRLDATDAELILAKQRNGPTGTVNLSWIGKRAWFTELAGVPAQAAA